MDWTAIKVRLVADKGNWDAVARATGLSGNQIRRIVHGETQSPRIDTAQKIAAYYDGRDAAPTAAA